jgi:DNA-binding response OmpR family regulator
MIRSPTILVVEDDAPVRRGLVDTLTGVGYEVLEAGDGKKGMELAERATIDLLLLDLVLPFFSGFQILEKVSQVRAGLPVIILSARGEENDRVKGLKMGADDYVVKPFSARELLARVDAVLRRSPERHAEMENFPIPDGTVSLLKAHVEFKNGDTESLSEREVELLRYMAAHAGRPLSRQEILKRVWRLDSRNLETRTVDMHIANLRTKFHDLGNAPRTIVTVRGKGYLLNIPE